MDVLFAICRTSWKSKCFLTWICLAGVARTQTAYFVDGYHGGVYGHYTDWNTRFMVDTLKQHPTWKISLEIEPETWDRAKTNDPVAYAELQVLAADQTARGRIEFVNPTYAQPYLWNIPGENIIRQFQFSGLPSRCERRKTGWFRRKRWPRWQIFIREPLIPQDYWTKVGGT